MQPANGENNATICSRAPPPVRAQAGQGQRDRTLSGTVSVCDGHRLLGRRVEARGNLRAHQDGPHPDRVHLRGSRAGSGGMVARCSDRCSLCRAAANGPSGIDRACSARRKSSAPAPATYRAAGHQLISEPSAPRSRSGQRPGGQDDVGAVLGDLEPHPRGGGQPPRVVGLDRHGIELRRLAAGDVVGEVLGRAGARCLGSAAGSSASRGCRRCSTSISPPRGSAVMALAIRLRSSFTLSLAM